MIYICISQSDKRKHTMKTLKTVTAELEKFNKMYDALQLEFKKEGADFQALSTQEDLISEITSTLNNIYQELLEEQETLNPEDESRFWGK